MTKYREYTYTRGWVSRQLVEWKIFRSDWRKCVADRRTEAKRRASEAHPVVRESLSRIGRVIDAAGSPTRDDLRPGV